MQTEWRIELLGGLRLRRQEQTLHQLKTRRMTLLLARLACFPHNARPRDVLGEELWPEDAPDAIRERFRQTLALLRRVLEPPPLPSGSVLEADRSTVRLVPHSFSTDIADFEAVIRLALEDADVSRQIELLRQAVSLYGGELLPGFYEEWVLIERGRLGELYRQALGRLTSALESAGQYAAAIEIAQKAVAVDALCEDFHLALIRLYAQTARMGDAERQYADMERRLRQELDMEPSAAAQTLMAQARAGALAAFPTPPAPQSALSPPAVSQPSVSQRPPANFAMPPAPALPVPLTRFFGREEEIARLTGLLSPVPAAFPAPFPSASFSSASPSPAPLVTLTGPGGAGKTRLALETVRHLWDAFAGAVWFVPLADVTHPELIGNAVVEALALPRSAQSEPLEQAVEYLRDYPAALLVLDNFEHLQEEKEQEEEQEEERIEERKAESAGERGEAGIGFVQSLRHSLPRLSCLVTSRHKLHLEGERDLVLPPLTTPDAPQAPEQLRMYPGVQLFLDRAQAARYSFALTSDNADAVWLLAQRLEGLPLAIELAAAWAATLTPEQILARLSRRFDLLVSRRKDVPARHQSLQAVLEGSYQQLPPRLQRLYARLSIFRGGWTLEASEQIAGVEVYGEAGCFQVMDGLALLQERSFLRAEERGAAMRYRMLESLREFGAEQMQAEERMTLARRHAEYFLGLAQEAQAHLRTPEEKPWLDRLEAEYDNFRSALEWTVANEVEIALKMSALLCSFWLPRGLAKEGSEWLRKALVCADELSPSRAEAINSLALMNLMLGEYGEGEKLARESLAVLRGLKDQDGMAKALNTLGALLMEQGNYDEAQARYEECLRLYRSEGQPRGEANVLANLGNLAFGRGEYDRACAYYSECLAARRALGDQRGIAATLDYLARTVREQGDYMRAGSLHSESLVMRRKLNDKQSIAASLNHLGTIKMYLDERQEARALLEESLVYCRELGDKVGAADALSQLGELSWMEQDAGEASGRWLASLAILEQAGDKAGIAAVLEALAQLAASDEQRYRAAQMLGRADALRCEISSPIRPSILPRYEQTVAAVCDALGAERFQQAWTEGQGLPLERVIPLAGAYPAFGHLPPALSPALSSALAGDIERKL